MIPKERKDREDEPRELDEDRTSGESRAVKTRSPPAANDNGVAWPLIPFPDGWHAS
jgi:hypothetical protein